MDNQKILALLQKEEGPKLDFKLKLNLDMDSSKKELAKDICAIANSRGGRGYILFGIRDKTKEIIGINITEFKEEQIQQVVSTRIDPPVPISVDIINIDTRNIGVITIYNTEQKPYQLRDSGAFYTRRGSTTDIMRKEEIASMIQDIGIINYELIPLPHAGLKDLDNEKVSDFLFKSGLGSKINESILIGTGILSKEKEYEESHPTYGGLLLLGKNPQLYLPHTMIKIFNSLNTNYESKYIVQGSLIDLLNNSFDFIKNCISDTNFPFEVIQDLLGKSIISRDYFDINNSIEIYIKKHTLEIIYPGTISSGRYIRRNLWLYLKALTIDNENKYINKNVNIYTAMKSYGKVKYYSIFSNNSSKIVIPITPF